MNLKKVNSIKKRFFKFLTSSFQNTQNPTVLTSDPNSHLNFLIIRPNHRLGNQLLIIPLILEIKQRWPNSKIDLIVNGNLAFVLFSKLDGIENIYNLPKKPFKNIFSYLRTAKKITTKKYDISIAGNEHSNSSKIFVKLSKSKNKIYHSADYNIYKPKHISHKPIYNLLKFLEPSLDLREYKYPKLSINLAQKEIKKGKFILSKLFNNKKEIICLYTYATGSKRHLEEWWLNVYDKLKKEFLNYNILEILPLENVSQLNFESVHFYSRDLREIASIIENCIVFVGADSGMMHLSSATNTPTIGLFNVTDPEIYAPYGNQNGWIDTNTYEADEIIEKIKEVTFNKKVYYPKH